MHECVRSHYFIHTYILSIYVVPKVTVVHMCIYIYTIYIEDEKNKLRYFDHTCRSGILYTAMCITFLSRAKVCRSSAFV